MTTSNLLSVALTLAVLMSAPGALAGGTAGRLPHAGNPILPGYYADPSIVTHEGRNFIYATLDPWGGETLGCWESPDFKNWTFRVLNWPTKAACTSPTSEPAMVWAPSVVRTADGRLFMYVSVGSEVWVGTAENPAGPWRDANGGKPLIPSKFKPGYHMIDAEAFVDRDGQAYLYWGSGWNWTNGKCWVVKLAGDMVTFEGEVKDVTPARYFEAPFMLRHDNRYYLMYSSGKTIETNYQVHCAVGDSPLGPFTEAENSPILSTRVETNVLSPGHHAVFEKDGRHFMLYHRHAIPFDPKFIGRQVCADELKFTPAGLMARVEPTHEGPAFLHGRPANRAGGKMSASSQRDAHAGAGLAADDNYATRWIAAPGEREPWLLMDLGAVVDLGRQEIRFEYAWKPYRFRIETSMDGEQWTPLADHTQAPASGSPVVIKEAVKARFLRLVFQAVEKGSEPGVFEWIAG
jgi:arabinoxylan arabinofuranohydrolase